MVSFTEIAKAIMENSEKEFSVMSCIPKHELSVPVYKLERTTIEMVNKNPFERITIRNQFPKVLSQPTPALRVTVTPVLSPVVDSCSEPDLEPVPIISVKLGAAPAASPVPTPVPTVKTIYVPVEQHIQTSIKPQSRQQKAQDPICIGISMRDPIYEIASASVKQSIEAEEARLLESKIAELYKSESGRSRGWTKKDLDIFFQSRAATGSSLHIKQSFVWSAVFSDKQTSALLDYVCISKGIRLAVWNHAEKCIGIWPAADLSTSKQTDYPLFHVNAEGVPLTKTSVFEDGWKLRATLSVEHGLDKLSIDELDSVAEKMGIMERMTGKKTERVRILAQARTEQRLQIK